MQHIAELLNTLIPQNPYLSSIILERVSFPFFISFSSCDLKKNANKNRWEFHRKSGKQITHLFLSNSMHSLQLLATRTVLPLDPLSSVAHPSHPHRDRYESYRYAGTELHRKMVDFSNAIMIGLGINYHGSLSLSLSNDPLSSDCPLFLSPLFSLSVTLTLPLYQNLKAVQYLRFFLDQVSFSFFVFLFFFDLIFSLFFEVFLWAFECDDWDCSDAHLFSYDQ